MNTETKKKRLELIRGSLQRGDVKRIAAIADVHDVWVSYVLHGRGVSERVLTIAETLIADRDKKAN